MDDGVKRLECGCVVVIEGGASKYTPCLPCALTNAGIMLQEAAKRLKEQKLGLN